MAGGQSREARKFLRKKQNKKSGCSAVGSAPALGAGCRRFESCHSDQNFDRKQSLFSTFGHFLCLFRYFTATFEKRIFMTTSSNVACKILFSLFTVAQNLRADHNIWSALIKSYFGSLFTFSNLLLNKNSLNIPKVLHPNVDSHHIQDTDELLHHLLICQSNMGNEYILIRHTPYRN